MNKNALITGITGQDGSYLAELLLVKGYKVFGLERHHGIKNVWRIDHIKGKINLIEGDLTDETSICSAIKTSEPHEVYNLGAQSFAPAAFKHPVYTAEVNAIGVLKLLEAVRASDTSIKVFQASSKDLYGKIREKPQNESTPFYPITPYGVAKLFGFWSVVNYREVCKLFAVNGVMFNHESPRRGIEFVTRKITNAVARIKLGIQDVLELGNLDAYRDWGHAEDYVNAMWLMLQQNNPDDFVIASGKAHSVKDFVEEAFRIAGMPIVWEGKGVNEVGKYDGKVVVCVNPKYLRPREVDNLVGDYSKARQVLGWKPKITFQELIQRMINSDIHCVQNDVVSNRN